MISSGAGGGLTQVAATPAAGAALVNGTPTILSWTAPNDGQLHSFMIGGLLDVTANETGGAIEVDWTNLGGGQAFTLYAAGLAAGLYYPSSSFTQPVVVQPGTTVTIKQASALTAGAAKLALILYAQ
jgi:hypothetical protein